METFTVKAFGMLAEKLNSDQVEVPFCKDTEELREEVYLKYPDLRGFNFSLAVDKKISHENIPLNGNEELALLPPFSGG